MQMRLFAVAFVAALGLAAGAAAAAAEMPTWQIARMKDMGRGWGSVAKDGERRVPVDPRRSRGDDHRAGLVGQVLPPGRGHDLRPEDHLQGHGDPAGRLLLARRRGWRLGPERGAPLRRHRRRPVEGRRTCRSRGTWSAARTSRSRAGRQDRPGIRADKDLPVESIDVTHGRAGRRRPLRPGEPRVGRPRPGRQAQRPSSRPQARRRSSPRR